MYYITRINAPHFADYIIALVVYVYDSQRRLTLKITAIFHEQSKPVFFNSDHSKVIIDTKGLQRASKPCTLAIPLLYIKSFGLKSSTASLQSFNILMATKSNQFKNNT